MIVLLKVYQTLYQNDEQKILYVLIIKSKFSNYFFKNVRFPYFKNSFGYQSYFLYCIIPTLFFTDRRVHAGDVFGGSWEFRPSHPNQLRGCGEGRHSPVLEPHGRSPTMTKKFIDRLWFLNCWRRRSNKTSFSLRCRSPNCMMSSWNKSLMIYCFPNRKRPWRLGVHRQVRFLHDA